MKLMLVFIMLLMVIGCKHALTRQEKEERLKKAMTTYLYEKINNDSQHVKFRVESVSFFEDKAFYDCEFNVHMIQNNHDTAGIMTATISKSFKKVKRKS